MSLAIAIEDPGSLTRPISPFRELGAYEALWTEPKASFRTIAERFRERPGSLPSDFVPLDDSLRHANLARKMLHEGG